MPPKKFVAALRKPLLEKRIASHKKILYSRNIRIFHEKYVYKKRKKDILVSKAHHTPVHFHFRSIFLVSYHHARSLTIVANFSVP